MSEAHPTVALAIPTYLRGQVLVDTLCQALEQDPPADEVLVIDQTLRHQAHVESYLTAQDEAGRIRWLRQAEPNAQKARNRALEETFCDVILFIDDDVVLPPAFVQAHRKNYLDPEVAGVAGRVISHLTPPDAHLLPVCRPRGTRFDFRYFRLDGSRRVEGVANLIGANHSIRRRCLQAIGGCDETYVGAFFDDTDTVVRLWQAGRRVVYDPDAWLEHLMAPRGGHGVRSKSLARWRRHFAPHYFYLRHVFPHWIYWLDVPLRMARGAILNRETLRRPWLIPWAAAAYSYAFCRAVLSRPRLPGQG